MVQLMTPLVLVLISSSLAFSPLLQPLAVAARCAAPLLSDDSLTRAALERLLIATEEEEDSSEDPLPPAVLCDLPLWRVQWVALPGHVQCLHVHVPHYVDMFERLVAGAGGAAADEEDAVFFGADGPLYGHLLLPGGSASLGKDSSNLAVGTSAPTVGALMRLSEIKRLGDGRLAVRADAIGRFRVLRSRQATPYSRADVILYPDGEEVLEALASLSSTATKPMEVPEDPVRIGAAMAAAAAASLARSDYEVVTEPPAPDAELNELCVFNEAVDEMECAAKAAASAAAAAAATTPEALAAIVRADEIEQCAGEPRWANPSWAPWRRGPASGADREVDSAAERDVAVSALAKMEDAVWSELLSCLRLTHRLKAGRVEGTTPDTGGAETPSVSPGADADRQEEEARAVAGLPPQVRMLRPPSDGEAPLSELPPLRRAQRLSYLVLALLPDLDRQKLLQCATVIERLAQERSYLQATRERLAAIVSLRDV